MCFATKASNSTRTRLPEKYYCVNAVVIVLSKMVCFLWHSLNLVLSAMPIWREFTGIALSLVGAAIRLIWWNLREKPGFVTLVLEAQVSDSP